MSEFKTNKISPRKGTTQTIGDSGDTLSIPCGVTVTNAGTITTAGISGGTINNSGGTISGLRGQVEWDTTAKTTAFTAEANKGYFCNTTSAAFTVTLPASPSVGDVIAIKDYANTFDTNNLTLNANGNKIQGSTTNFDITVEGANSQFIYVDATRGWVLTDASKASDIAENLIVATGGTITTCGNYKIHTFTGPGTFCVSNAGTGSVDYLVVAGGAGGAGARGGGGGAGGYRESKCSTTSGCWTASPIATCTSLPIIATAYPITVGGGGSGGNSASGSNGNNSILSTIISTGGGFGRSLNDFPVQGGGPGGSGGGAGFNGTGGSGNTPPVSPPQGNNGGDGDTNPCGSNAGGGGGGAAVAGGASPPPTGAGGNGGNGQPSGITGSSVTRAGGGGGAGEPPQPVGTGGTGGGGNGSHSNGISGTANTGGGGGAGGNEPTIGGSGGSGIVIIRYKYQ